MLIVFWRYVILSHSVSFIIMAKFVQVHDARIPFSGRNLTFRDVVGGARPHLLILNKADLIPESDQEAIRKESMRQSPHISRVLFTNCKSFYCPQTAAIIPTVSKLVGAEDRSTPYLRLLNHISKYNL